MIGSGYNGYSQDDFGDIGIWTSGLATTPKANMTNYLKSQYGIA
jgi:hypothetical protein